MRNVLDVLTENKVPSAVVGRIYYELMKEFGFNLISSNAMEDITLLTSDLLIDEMESLGGIEEWDDYET